MSTVDALKRATELATTTCVRLEFRTEAIAGEQAAELRAAGLLAAHVGFYVLVGKSGYDRAMNGNKS